MCSQETYSMPSSWTIWNMTHDVVREITCQVRLVVVRQLHHGAAGGVTFTLKEGGSSYGLKWEEANWSDKLIYLTPLTSVARGEARSFFNMSPGPASLSASAVLLGALELMQGGWQWVCIVVKTIWLVTFWLLLFFLHDEECGLI